jgi:aminoglycoside phosphotransferase (APT) family kinase protein
MVPAMSDLSERIEALLRERTGGPVKVKEVRPLAGGACQDNYRVELELPSGPSRKVLRSDAMKRLPGSIGRAQEYEVIRAAVAAGVRTPQAQWLSSGLVRPGAHAYFLDWIDGEAIGRRVVKHPELAAARERLPEQLAQVLARIHTVTRQSAPSLPICGALLGELRQTIDLLPEPHPAIELAFRWLEDNAPGDEETTLVHGDYRTGNFMVTPEGLAGVLDWEFSHWGSPLEDVGWLCVRDWRFGELSKAAGGLATRADFYKLYQEASGRRVDPERVRYWEVFGNVRWGVGSVYQGERYLSGEERDLELVAIARRAIEMEYEALRLIDGGH